MLLNVAILTGSISIGVLVFTQASKFIVEHRKKKQIEKMHLISIKSELEMNKDICIMILNHPEDIRTLGFRFIDDIWKNADKSVVFEKNMPSSKILKLYTKIQYFNFLLERRRIIQEQKDYSDTDEVAALERQEMFLLVKELKSLIEDTLQEFPLLRISYSF